VKKYLLLSFLVVAFFALSIGNANAVWKIGGTGPFLNYPFYIEGAADGVSFKTFAVVNNTDSNSDIDIVAAIHYVVSDNDASGTIGFPDLGCQGDPACPYVVNSEFTLRDTHLTKTESMIFTPGTSNPALGPEVTIWSDAAFAIGWVELWSYDPRPYVDGNVLPHPPLCSGKLRGEAVTLDLGHGSAWTYKAVASVWDPAGFTSDMFTISPASPTAVPPVSCAAQAATYVPPIIPAPAPNAVWDVWWKNNPSWHPTFILPTGYNHLGASYNLDLWVKAPAGGNTNNNTIIILTNPNHRKLAGSDNTCRDCTHVSVDLFNSYEQSDHKEFDVCEMRILSVLDDFSSTIANTDSFYGWGIVNENDDNISDSQAGLGCTRSYGVAAPQWIFQTQGPTNVITNPGPNNCCLAGTGAGTPNPCFPNGPQTICGLVNPADLAQGCNDCDILTGAPENRSQGILAVAYTSWQAVGGGAGLTYWGNNMFNNCGDATAWNMFGPPALTTVNNCP